MNRPAGSSAKRSVLSSVLQYARPRSRTVAVPCAAPAAWPKARARGLGDDVVYWDVRDHGRRRGAHVLQAGHKVRQLFDCRDLRSLSAADPFASSIQTWAMKEAKERMEARGEATEYKPKAISE